MAKAKLVHLKDEKGKSFYVTPHAFETNIKTDKNWRKKYDYVGEVDEESVGVKSDSAKVVESKNENISEKEKVSDNEREQDTADVFKSNNDAVEKFEGHIEKAGELASEGKFKEAKEEIKQALLLSPNSKAAGRMLAEMNEREEEKSKADKVSKYLETAKKEMGKKKLERAKVELEKLTAIDPENEEAKLLLAEIEQDSKKD